MVPIEVVLSKCQPINPEDDDEGREDISARVAASRKHDGGAGNRFNVRLNRVTLIFISFNKCQHALPTSHEHFY